MVVRSTIDVKKGSFHDEHIPRVLSQAKSLGQVQDISASWRCSDPKQVEAKRVHVAYGFPFEAGVHELSSVR